MDFEYIKNLSTNEKINLINLIEGMPSGLNKYVKMNINEDFLNPSLFKGQDRTMSEYASISRYLDSRKNGNVVTTTNPEASMYQSRYCKIQKEISESKFPNEIKRKLALFMDAECYDDESLMMMEMYISKLLKEFDQNEFIEELAKFINEEIIPYKLDVYDFYIYLSVKNVLNIVSGEYNHLFNINCAINSIIREGSSYSDKSDLAALIYVYFKEIGVSEISEKYNLIDRFILAILYYKNDTDFCEEIIDMVRYYINSKSPITNVIDTLIKSNKYGKLLNSSFDNLIEQNEDMTYKSIEHNGMIYLFENPYLIKDNIDIITNTLRMMTIDKILEYTEETNKNYINFTLNDNDYGHLKSLNGMEMGTSYDRDTCDIKYLGSYNGTYFLFFKNRLKPNVIYGISLDMNNENKKIIEIKESKMYRYHFVTNI